MKIEYSEDINERNMKILLWGDTGSRKTETVLRNFPDVMLIDAEGNSDQCLDMDEIPPFLRVMTKDPREAVEIINLVKTGKIKFPDGRPVQTLAVDIVTVIWNVQQEFGAAIAEKRALKKRYEAETANMTQLDWVLAKRPMKQIANIANGSGIRYMVFIARQKDQYEENADGELKKIGLIPDVVKGFDYEMNLALHLLKTPLGAYEVTKTQGGLGKIFPMGTRGKSIPLGDLFAYSETKRVSKIETSSEDTVGKKIAEDKEQSENIGKEHSKEALIEFGKKLNVSAEEIAAALKASDIGRFDKDHWTEMTKAVTLYAEKAQAE